MLDFYHYVQTTLLLNVFLLKLLGLQQLLVPDSYSLGVEHHVANSLHFIVLLFLLILGFG